MKTSSRSFSQVILLLFSIILFFSGTLLLVFTEEIQEASLAQFKGIANRLSIVIQQFLGNAYILLGVVLYLLKDSKGRDLLVILTALVIMGFINLYLIFQFNDLIILPTIYFVVQLLLQLVLFLALIDEVKRN